MGWKWRSFPTLVGFALGGLIASAAFYFTEPILLSFLLYVVFLFLSSFCLMRYTFRWSALKRIQARQRAERQAQQAAPRSGTTSQ